MKGMNETKSKFTAQQLQDWKKYERVRKSGLVNMWFPEGRDATGLSEKRYLFCLQYYTELKSAAESEEYRK